MGVELLCRAGRRANAVVEHDPCRIPLLGLSCRDTGADSPGLPRLALKRGQFGVYEKSVREKNLFSWSGNG